MKTIKAMLLLALFTGLTGCTNSNPISPSTTPIITETITPIRTQIPSATFTLTPVVTLSPEQWEQQFNIILDMVNMPDAGCTLPCWWGITPGKTTWAEAGRILDQAGLTAFEYRSSKLTSQGLQMYSVSGQLNIYFYIRGEIVNHIIIGDYSVGSPQTLENTWPALSPAVLITELGVPSRVLVDGYCGQGEGATKMDCQYALFSFYDSRGIYIHNSFYTNQGSSDPICPTFGEGGNTQNWFKIILKSPEDITPIELYDEAYHPELAISFDVATGMTLDDYYQVFLQTDSPPCFHILPGVLK